MHPEKGKLKCKKCQFEKEFENHIVSKVLPKGQELKIIETKEETLPKTRVECPECSNKEAYWVIKQIRGSDEPETKFYICTKCNYRWREE
jgi:DNA-directed RNA polymerase subunit M